jgi:hypothetical protein
LKQMQEKAGNTLETINIGNDFLSWTQTAQKLRKSIYKWGYMKLKASTQQKKWSPKWIGCSQNGRTSLLVIHLTRD